jgi:hypothetical protein
MVIFFCTWLWLFRARSQATVAPKRLGWITKRLSKKPGSGVSVLVFAHGVSGGKGMGTTCTSAFFFKFYSVHSTAHGKPLVVDSSSYV